MLVVSHYHHDIPCKNYKDIFELSKLCPKYCLSIFFLEMVPKMAFFDDVTITSSLYSVVQVLIEHFKIFQSHRITDCQDDSCQKL